MESLAFLVVFLLAGLYFFALVAAGLSFVDHKVARFATWGGAGVATVYGLWIVIALGNVNGWLVGGVPVLISAFAVWNALRVRRKAQTTPTQAAG